MGQNSFYRFVVYNPWKTIVLSVLCVLAMGVFLKDVAPSVSYKDMLGEDYPLLQTFERIQQAYTNDDNILVLIEAKEGSVFQKEILEGVKNLTEELWQTPFSVRVDSLTNFQHTVAHGDDLVVADLVDDPGSLDAQRLSYIRDVALSEPQLLNRAINQSSTVTAINISFAFPNVSLNEKLQADEFVQKTVEVFAQQYPQTNSYVAGIIALDATVMRISQKESGMFLMLILVMVLVLLMIMLRRIRPVLATLFVVLFSIAAGMAFSGFMGWKLTPFTASVPMMILVLAVADSVHLISGYLQSLAPEKDNKAALLEALQSNGKPIAVTSITTAIGFLTLNFSESESIGALGSQVAFGVMVAYGLSVSLLPALLSFLPVKPKAFNEKRKSKFAGQLAGAVIRFNGRILIAFSLLFGMAALFIPNNEFNDNLPTYFAESLPWRQANDFAEKEFGGAYTFSYSLHSEQPGGIASPEYLKRVEAFTDWLRSLPEVAHVATITDTVKRLNKSMHGDDPSHYVLPDDQALTAQYILLYEMSLPFGLDLNNQINLDKSATKVVITFRTMSTQQVLNMEQKIATYLDHHMPGINKEGTGVQLMFAHLLNDDTKGLIWGAVLGLLFISLLLVVAFSSLKMGLLSVLPNLFPVAMAFGVWGAMVGQVGMGMAMVSGITIGVVVDDTVHFLHKYYVQRFERGGSVQEALEYAYQNAGVAIMLTTFVLMAGFLSMMLLSEFRVNSDMGKMACLVMFFAMVIDLLVLPAVIALLDRNKVKAQTINLSAQSQEA